MGVTPIDIVREVVEQFGIPPVLIIVFCGVWSFVLICRAVYDHVWRAGSMWHAREAKRIAQRAVQDMQALYEAALEPLQADAEYLALHSGQTPAVILDELKTTGPQSLSPRHPLYTDIFDHNRQQQQLNKYERRLAEAEQEISRLQSMNKVRYAWLQLRRINWKYAVRIATMFAVVLTTITALALWLL